MLDTWILLSEICLNIILLSTHRGGRGETLQQTLQAVQNQKQVIKTKKEKVYQEKYRRIVNQRGNQEKSMNSTIL